MKKGRLDPGPISSSVEAKSEGVFFQWAKFLVIFLAMSAGIGGAGYFYFAAQKRAFQKSAYAQLSAVADLKSREITEWRSERLRDGQALRDNLFLTPSVRNALSTSERESANARAALRAWFESLRANNDHSQVFLLDGEGNWIMGTEDMSWSEENDPVYRRALEIALHGVVALSDLYRGRRSGDIRVDMFVPIPETDGGKSGPLGIILIRRDPARYLYPLIQSWPTPSSSAEALLVRRDGKDVLFLSQLRHRKGTTLEFRLPLSTEGLPAARAVQGKQGVFQGVDYRGVPVLSVLRPVIGSEWFLVAKVDRKEVFAPFVRESRYLAASLLGLILMAGSGLGYIIRREQIGILRRRLLAEEELRSLSLRQEAILTAVPDIIMEVDNDKVYRWANKAGTDFFGDDAVGKEAAFYFVGEQPTYRIVQPFFEGAEDVIYLESWQRRKDGQARLLAWWCRTLKDADGRVTGALSSAWDITEQRRAEEEIRLLNENLERRVAERTVQLDAANKELESFSYSVSHDLRAPLRIIDGFSQVLVDDCREAVGDKGRDYLARIRAATQRMGLLIDDLLKLARLSKSPLQRQEVDLSGLAREVAASLRQSAPERDAEIVIRDGLLARADPALIKVVLENLLANAWKFTGKKPRARIELGRLVENGRDVFFVKDDGVGFDMAYADKLFGAFQRLHRKEDFPGLGVGLATVQRIVRRHGGRVWAESAPERGATFYFMLDDGEGGSDGR